MYEKNFWLMDENIHVPPVLAANFESRCCNDKSERNVVYTSWNDVAPSTTAYSQDSAPSIMILILTPIVLPVASLS